MKTLLLAITIFGLTACASPGTTPAQDAPSAATTPEPEAAEQVADTEVYSREWWDEIVCRREPVTGTRLTRARCHSRYDWVRMRDAATETMRQIESMPRGVREPGPD